jgi:hypothetical protein
LEATDLAAISRCYIVGFAQRLEVKSLGGWTIREEEFGKEVGKGLKTGWYKLGN